MLFLTTCRQLTRCFSIQACDGVKKHTNIMDFHNPGVVDKPIIMVTDNLQAALSFKVAKIMGRKYIVMVLAVKFSDNILPAEHYHLECAQSRGDIVMVPAIDQ